MLRTSDGHAAEAIKSRDSAIQALNSALRVSKDEMRQKRHCSGAAAETGKDNGNVLLLRRSLTLPWACRYFALCHATFAAERERIVVMGRKERREANCVETEICGNFH